MLFQGAPAPVTPIPLWGPQLSLQLPGAASLLPPHTCWTCSTTTCSLASSGDSTSKQSSRSVGDTVSREWEGRNMRWKRFLITYRGAGVSLA